MVVDVALKDEMVWWLAGVWDSVIPYFSS
ncbi:hypothetical protein L195_g062149, partial [Trifolium pratense]